jgi:Electron transfer flavoprotein, alpha subunit
VSGIRDCGTVVSINIDPDAPIKDFSDLFVVGDLYDIVKKLIDRLGG